MSIAAQPIDADDGALSPWWLRAILAVMVLGFSGLIMITMLSYQNAPPVPDKSVDRHGVLVFSGDDIREGQAIFLKYGLMANGSIWGHGAYLGPDYSAAALHRMGQETAQSIARQQFSRPIEGLTRSQQAAVQAETAVELKSNHFEAASSTLQLSGAQVAAFQNEIVVWTGYFRQPARNGGLKQNLITDPSELRQFAAFVTWAAWASVAARPGQAYSYTNNFPYDPSVGNLPTSGALFWSAMSLIVFLAGVATVLLAFGKFDFLGWITRGHHVHPQLLPGQSGPGQ